jgi:predicted O-methyltransferase YrrM
MLDMKVPRLQNLSILKFHLKSQEEFLTQLNFADELKALNFDFKNGSFESADADFLYQFIRFTKPNRVLEIGGGESTKLIQLALEKNCKSFKHICVEPFEDIRLIELNRVEIIKKKIEDIELEEIKKLDKGDLLFIDSSHIIRPQGDVLFEYLEILPNLAVGVNIHIHDVYTPRDYPKNMIQREIRFWNEQYILESILLNSNNYEVIAALNYLKNESSNELSKICPNMEISFEPGSIYLKKVN